jgi:hypothetical protein
MKDQLIRLLGAGIMGLAIFGAVNGAITIANRATTADTVDIKNLVIEKPTYVKSCVHWAKLEESAEKLTDEILNSYCGCVYDKGVAMFGNAKFIELDEQVNKTGNLTPELNTIVNECVQSVI